MNERQSLVLRAVTRLNGMVSAAYDGMEVHPATMYQDGLFTAVFAENWESIDFLTHQGVWCPETDQCDTPDDGETVESIVSYVWEDELKDLVALLVAFGKQCEKGKT